MKLGPLLLLSLIIHGVLLLALHAAPDPHPPAAPLAPPLVWMQLAAPAAGQAAAPAAEREAPRPAIATAPATAAAPATARRARSALAVSAAPDESGAGVELPVESESGGVPAGSVQGVRDISGPAVGVPALPGALQAGAPPSAPAGPAFDARAYADFIRRRIDAEKQYPARARRMGLQGVATVLVAVDSRGRLARPPRLARTSGVAALDHEALRMVEAAAPFTPPAGAPSPAAPIEVQVPVRFSLADPP